MNLTAEQQAIIGWFREGAGNLVVRARAGTGKTSTVLRGIDAAPERRILLCAFNKRIAQELTERLENPRAEAKTLHGVGYACVRRYWEGVRVDGRCRAEEISRAVVEPTAPDAMVRMLSKLHTKAREMHPLATIEQVRDLAFEFDCVPDDDWCDDGYDLDWIASRTMDAMAHAARVKPRAIDFADMLFLPVRNNWVRPRYDLVVVDECQDMNAAQITIAQRISKGRIAVVGDDRQAIYGFRGADSGSLDRLRGELDATELPMTRTFRCGKRIVAEAQALVADYVADDSNGDGAVTTLPIEKLVDSVAVGDFVLSRKNAPLASIALRTLKRGMPCRIQGRDIGAGLQALVRKLAKGKARNSLPEFRRRLVRHRDREIERLTRADDERGKAKAAAVEDRIDLLDSLCDGLSGIGELQARIESLFADSGRPAVICSSVHRSKGLEADRVFLLDSTLYPSRGNDHREEQNIEYVAITRAKRELVRVRGELDADD